MVDPVVNTSSTSNMWDKSVVFIPGLTENAPATFLVFASTLSLVWVTVRRFLVRMSVLSGFPVACAISTARISA